VFASLATITREGASRLRVAFEACTCCIRGCHATCAPADRRKLQTSHEATISTCASTRVYATGADGLRRVCHLVR
jgi:hypothetical protein